MKTAFILLVLLIGSIAATGSAGGFGEPTTSVDGLQLGGPIATIEHDSGISYTIIEAEVENTGFENFFVALPKDWTFDSDIYGARGEPIIISKGELYKKYGSLRDRSSFISNNFVLDTRGGFSIGRGSPLVLEWSDGGDSFGWFVRPNERLVFTIKMTPSDSEAVIDPFAIERNRTDIKVVKWNQEMIVYPESGKTGFLSAPWIVKGATMVEATPGVFTNISDFKEDDIYWASARLQNKTSEDEEDEPVVTSEPVVELDPPEWDSWFSSSGFFGIESTSLAPLATEFLPIPEINKTVPVEEAEEVEETESVFIPVWLIDPEFYQGNSVGTTLGAAIRYSYEWSLGKEITGVDKHLFTGPYKTRTEIYGGGTSTPAPTEAPAESEEKPELDLTIVPEWYTWFN